MRKLLLASNKRNNEVVIVGDFNLDLLKYDTHQPTASYLELVTEQKLLPRIVRPTRIKKQSATLIDHILSSETGITLKSGIIDTEIAGGSGYTDQFPTFTVLKIGKIKKTKSDFVEKVFFTSEGSNLSLIHI